MDGAELRPRATAFPPAGRRFFKYDALGNDYIVLDPADWPEPPTAETRSGASATGITAWVRMASCGGRPHPRPHSCEKWGWG